MLKLVMSPCYGRSHRDVPFLQAMVVCGLLILSLLAPAGLQAAEPALLPGSVFKLKTYEDESGTHKYAIFLPTNYDASRKWPVVLFLHGAGERGTDGVLPTRIGLGAALQAHPENYPFIAVFPQVEDMQCRYLEGWVAGSSDGERALKILDEVISEYSVDPNRQMLTGWSMGGYGAWSLAAAHPERWSGVMPLSGGGNPDWAEKLANTPVWSVHGLDDYVVLPEESRNMAKGFAELGTNPPAHFSFVKNGDHNVWRNTYGYGRVIRWLTNPVAENYVDLTMAEPLIDPLPAPFIPALELHRAAKVRLGNKAFEAFSYAIPSRIPTSLLAGGLQNIQTSTAVEGYNFGVVFSGNSYRAQLERVSISTTPDNLLSFRLGFKRIDLTLGRTAVQGERHSASAGPIQVQLGTREPVWLDLRVEPYLDSGRIRFHNKRVQVSIDPGNMSVSPPSGVTVDGFGMTRERVSRGLVNGLYSSRSRIEQEMQQLAPRIIGELENRLDLNEIVKNSTSVWPLPVYAPRIKVQPNSISVDSGGLTMGLDFLVASFIESHAPESPRIVINEDNLEVGSGAELEIALATNTMTEAMRLMIEERLARIDVEDIPGTAFDHWSDNELWEQILAPSGKPVPEGPKRVRLTLNQPLSFGPRVDIDETPGSSFAEQAAVGGAEILSASRSQLRLNDVQLRLMVKDPGRFSKRWKTYALLRFDLKQTFDFSFVKPAHMLREIRVSFPEPMKVAVTSLPDGDVDALDMNTEVAGQEFGNALQQWLNKATDQPMQIPDIDLKACGLRADELIFDDHRLIVGFSTPVVRIINTTDVPQRYQTRGPFTDWSQDWVLEPGKTHHFTVPYPLYYRRTSPEVNELYTLPLGGDSEFRWTEADGDAGKVARLYLRPQRPEQVEPVDSEQITRSEAETVPAQ